MELNDPTMTGQLEYERVEGDFYATPQENVDCLAHFFHLKGLRIWEPACGEGHISKRLIELGYDVSVSSEKYARGYGLTGIDFLNMPRAPFPHRPNCIITNPPFGDEAEKFIRHSHELMKGVEGKVCMFLRNEYDCGMKRNDLFGECEYFAAKIVVQKRPRWFEGSKGSPRHNYAWYIWDFNPMQALAQPTLHYIHPKNAVAL